MATKSQYDGYALRFAPLSGAVKESWSGKLRSEGVASTSLPWWAICWPVVPMNCSCSAGRRPDNDEPELTLALALRAGDGGNDWRAHL